jgi:endo-1,4-beta-mannosidase
MSEQKYENEYKLLCELAEKLKNLGISTYRLGSLIGEIYVAKELEARGLKPVMGNKRKKKDADINLNLGDGKRVEVKYAAPHIFKGIKAWGFNFKDGKQIEKGIEYFVLVKSNENGIPFEAIVLDLNDMGGKNWRCKIAERTSEGNKHYDIHLCESYEDYNKYIEYMSKIEKDWKENPLEKDMHEHPDNYRNRWDKIKK